jgi:hypothetical protein
VQPPCLDRRRLARLAEPVVRRRVNQAAVHRASELELEPPRPADVLLNARPADEPPVLQRVRAHVKVSPARIRPFLAKVPRTIIPSILAEISGLRG